MKRFISIILNVTFILTIINGQATDSFKKGDIAPNWSLKSNQGKFEFLNNWTVEHGRQLRKPSTQPDRHVVVITFFATSFAHFFFAQFLCKMNQLTFAQSHLK